MRTQLRSEALASFHVACCSAFVLARMRVDAPQFHPTAFGLIDRQHLDWSLRDWGPSHGMRIGHCAWTPCLELAAVQGVCPCAQ